MSYNPKTYGYGLSGTSPFTSSARLPYARTRAIYGGQLQDEARVMVVRWGLNFGVVSFDAGFVPGFTPNPSPDILGP
jgi:hypothetical protein